MTDKPQKDHPLEMASESQNLSGLKPSVFSGLQKGVKSDVEKTLSKKESKLKELSKKRENGEVDPFDFDLNELFQLQQAQLPLTCKEAGTRAVVLSSEDFDALGYIDILLPSGEEIRIESDSLDRDDVLILYPGDVG